MQPNKTKALRLQHLPGCSTKFSTGIKDAGIAIRHSRGYLFYTAESRNELEGSATRGSVKLSLRKRYFFVIEKCIEDVKQEEKHVLDLVEAIMKGSGIVKEELRPNLF